MVRHIRDDPLDGLRYYTEKLRGRPASESQYYVGIVVALATKPEEVPLVWSHGNKSKRVLDVEFCHFGAYATGREQPYDIVYATKS